MNKGFAKEAAHNFNILDGIIEKSAFLKSILLSSLRTSVKDMIGSVIKRVLCSIYILEVEHASNPATVREKCIVT